MTLDPGIWPPCLVAHCPIFHHFAVVVWLEGLFGYICSVDIVGRSIILLRLLVVWQWIGFQLFPAMLFVGEWDSGRPAGGLLKTSRLACENTLLGGAVVRIGSVDNFMSMGAWSLEVMGPCVTSVLWYV